MHSTYAQLGRLLFVFDVFLSSRLYARSHASEFRCNAPSDLGCSFCTSVLVLRNAYSSVSRGHKTCREHKECSKQAVRRVGYTVYFYTNPSQKREAQTPTPKKKKETETGGKWPRSPQSSISFQMQKGRNLPVSFFSLSRSSSKEKKERNENITSRHRSSSNVTELFRYGLHFEISSAGGFLTSVFIAAFFPARWAAGLGGNGSAAPPGREAFPGA